MAFLHLEDQPLGPPQDQAGWYEVALDDETLLALWWDGRQWSDDAGGNEPWSRNATDGIRRWRRLLAQPDNDASSMAGPEVSNS